MDAARNVLLVAGVFGIIGALVAGIYLVIIFRMRGERANKRADREPAAKLQRLDQLDRLEARIAKLEERLDAIAPQSTSSKD